jgi:hypothetical protein
VPASGDRGEIIAFYAVARFTTGGHHFDVMTRAEVEAIRDKSQAWMAFKAGKIQSTPWGTDFPEMGKKTAIRRISKYLPMNVQKAAAISEMYESGRHSELGDAGELIVDAPDMGSGPAIDVGAESATSKLDQFASDAPAVEAAAGAAAPTASSSGDPELFSPEKRASLIAQTEKQLGCGATEAMDFLDGVCSDLCGSGLNGTPASFETSILKMVERAAKARKR